MAWSRRPPSPPEENALELELEVAAGVTQGDQPVVAEEVELSLLAAPRSPRRTASRTWKRRGALALAPHVTPRGRPPGFSAGAPPRSSTATSRRSSQAPWPRTPVPANRRPDDQLRALRAEADLPGPSKEADYRGQSFDSIEEFVSSCSVGLADFKYVVDPSFKNTNPLWVL